MKKQNRLAKPLNLFAHIVRQLRDRFYVWPPYIQTVRKARRERVRYKENGEKSKRPYVEYECASCKSRSPRSEVQVDHITPVIALTGPGSIQELVDRQFTSDLQMLCKACHKQKTNKERKERNIFKKAKDSLK